MRRKDKRKLAIVAMAYLYFATIVSLPQFVMAAASGNYTDLLPIGAAGNTTVISNGSGWSLTTLPPTQTFGDALSRVETVVYQSTGMITVAPALTVGSTFTALNQGNVGSTTFPASWVASGRTIETVVEGDYSTPTAGENWTWAVKLGTTSILSTGAVAAVKGQTKSYFKARSTMTIGATGGTGTVFGSYDIVCSSGGIGAFSVNFSTYTATAVTVDLTTQLTVNPVLTFATGTSSFTVRNVSVRFLN